MTETPWYEHWFGEEYLRLYPHRDEEEARRAIQLVLGHAELEPDGRTLDLACGAGRHLRELRRLGLQAFGLDLSLPLLERARAENLSVVRGDMRDLPFRSHSFSLVTNFFTSFGYFADPEEDLDVLREVHRVLQPGGTFAFDFLNADRVRAELRPRDEREVNGVRVVQKRTLVEGGNVVEKRIEIHDPSDRVPRVFRERVRLYAPDELRRLLSEQGLVPRHGYGSYAGEALSQTAPRVIFIGRSS